MALYRVTLRRSEGDDKSPTARVVYVVSAGGIANPAAKRNACTPAGKPPAPTASSDAHNGD